MNIFGLCNPALEEKLTMIRSGEEVVMSDDELNQLIEFDLLDNDVVSMPNPKQVGIRDAYLVGNLSCPAIRTARTWLELQTHAARACVSFKESVWDEPKDAASARGWYWPSKTTKRGETLCAGTYLEYGPHYRSAAEQEKEPGLIACAVFSRITGLHYKSCYVSTVQEAREWIAKTAQAAGHIA